MHRPGTISLNLLLIITLYAVTSFGADSPSKSVEPTKASEVAANQVDADVKLEAQYQAWIATLPPEQQAWERTLQENLMPYYRPLRKQAKLAGTPDAWDFVQDNPKLPRVLIIGDSISRGYTLAVRNALASKANVHRAPANCGPTELGIEKIDLWLGDGKWDVIHFNFGCHDRETPIADYNRRLEQLVKRMKQTGARLMWASTTPIPDDPSKNHVPTSIVERNAAAAEIMQKHGVAINDLFTAVSPHVAQMQVPQDVHFKQEGYAFLGLQVTSAIERLLEAE
jgi:hypothetical protein